jgi:UDP-N-acetyl-D-mannosaminuronic acid dehydrogenase
MIKKTFQTISVIGLGYIGLPTAAVLASRRCHVVGVDVNAHAVDIINQGKIHIVEPELDMVVHAAVTEGYLRATTQPVAADAFLIAVPTPFKGDYEPDLAYVEAASRSIAPVLKRGDVVILESTSPVGTTEQMAQWLAEVRPDLRFPVNGVTDVDVHVAYCPERVLPGQVVRELVENDRIIGGLTPACSAIAAEVYQLFVQGELLITNAQTAEMSKLTENSFRDVNIAFANELSLICDQLGIDVWELIRLANRHPRVKILQPGAGVGGHCIAVDPWFIVHRSPNEAKLIRAAREVNDGKPAWVVQQVRDAARRQAERKKAGELITVALLGLAFKPNIDDLRESPALHIAEALTTGGSERFLVVEPNIESVPPSLKGQRLVALEEAVAEADVVAVLVAHREFDGLKSIIRPGQVLVDVVGLSSQ